MSQAFGKRPSEILRIDDEWTAWQLDETCLIVGREVENENAEVPEGQRGRGTKVQRRRGAEVYAPMKIGDVPKMKIPENGIW